MRIWPRSWLTLTVLQVNAALATLVLLSWYCFGSVTTGAAYLRGDRLIPDAYSKSFGIVDGGSTSTIVFKLRNFLNRPITVIGSRATCSCLLAEAVPLTVPASRSSNFTIRVVTGKKKGALSASMKLYTDSPETPVIVLTTSGVVRYESTVGNGKAENAKIHTEAQIRKQ